MTNINCSSNCIYQQDGKCGLEKVAKQTKITPDADCLYYNSLPKSPNFIDN